MSAVNQLNLLLPHNIDNQHQTFKTSTNEVE